MKEIKTVLPRATLMLLIFTLVCGIIYSAAVTGLSQLIFPNKANGSIIEVNGKKYGCELLGQQYTDDRHMWGRIMNIDTTTFTDANGNKLMYSWPSNLSPASNEYAALVKKRVDMIKAANPDAKVNAIPVDLVTCSGSGLDPEISLAAAEYQVPRLAESNNITQNKVSSIIAKCANHRFLGVFGEETVNVLKVNLMLDGIL